MRLSLKLRFKPDFWYKHEKYQILVNFQYTKNYKNAFFSKWAHIFILLLIGVTQDMSLYLKKVTRHLGHFFKAIIALRQLWDGTSTTSIFNKASKTRTKVAHNNISQGFKMISFLALVKLDCIRRNFFRIRFLNITLTLCDLQTFEVKFHLMKHLRLYKVSINIKVV